MEHSKVKETINEVIGNEAWMTPTLARNMASQYKNKKKNFFPLPVIATLVLTACAIIIMLLPQQANQINASLNTDEFYAHIENKELAQAVIQYFETIQMEDRTAINNMFSSKQLLKAELLLQKYEDVKFETLKVLNITPLELKDVSIHVTYEQGKQTMMNKLQASKTNNEWAISENPTVNSVVYEPYSPPEKLSFNYEMADTLPLDNSYALKETYWTTSYNDLAFHFYEKGEKLDVVMQKEENYYYLMTMNKFAPPSAGNYPYFITQYENADQDTAFYSFSAKDKGQDQEIVYFYFNKQLNAFQVMKGEEGASSFTMNLEEEDGKDFIIINNRIPIVGYFESGNLFVTTPVNNIEQPWDDSFVSFLFSGTVISLHYNDVNGQKNANYLWDTKNEAIYVNDEKWN